MDPHALELVFRHSTTLLLGGLTGYWVYAVARVYAALLADGGNVDRHTLWRAVAKVLWFARSARQPARLSGGALACAAVLGVIWLALGFQPQPLRELALPALACSLLLLLALIDARTGYLPDALTYPFLLFGGLAGVWQGGLHALLPIMAGLALGVAVPLVGMLFHWLRHRQAGLGWGDVKLLAGMGVWLGAQGVIMALLMACVCGLAFTLCRNRGLRLQAGYPFGPFLALGTVLVMLRVV